jgi:dsRNA-specific ribonuclease
MLEQPISAQGPSRKRAEQLAAQFTLEKLQS